MKRTLLNSSKFIDGLEARDLASIATVPKTDLHNHGSLGFRLDTLRARIEDQIPDPPEIMGTFLEFTDYLKQLQDYLYSIEGFEPSLNDAVKTASDDAIEELELSIDCQVVPVFGSAQEVVGRLTSLFDLYPGVKVRPEVGINREWDEEKLDEWVVPMIETGFFSGIDLYGNEMFGEPEKFVRYYDLAKGRGMRRKAHAGEYLDADFIRRSVEVLDLEEVQHGISAASSPDTMRWLSDHGIRLNICPTSNIRLGRVARMADHPIAVLHRAGVHVTVNSDDILVFNKSVSEEYMELYTHGVLTAEELNSIRLSAFRGDHR